jgi:hypothetical protein
MGERGDGEYRGGKRHAHLLETLDIDELVRSINRLIYLRIRMRVI